MDMSKKFIEKLILDTATVVLISSAFLYGLGYSFSDGLITGYGLTTDILDLKIWDTLLFGFVGMLTVPFKSIDIMAVSLIGLIPFVLVYLKKTVSKLLIISGILFFIFFLFGASFESGFQWAKGDIEEFNHAYKNNTLEKLEYKKASLKLEDGEKKETVKGFALEIPGDYFVLVQKNKIIAIPKKHISQIEYEWPK